MWRRIGGALLLAAAVAAPCPAADDRVAERVLAGLAQDRTAAGLPELLRRADLDAVARERARVIAELPHAERLAHGEPIGDALRRGEVVWYRRAIAHLDMVRGYRRPEIGILRSWRTHESAWDKALSESFDAVGAASHRAEDGWVVFVAVLLAELPLPEDMRRVEHELVDAVNRVRRERGLAELQVMDPLAAVARAHSEDMASRSYLAHVSPEGLGSPERVDRAGLPFDKLGENILMNRGSAHPVENAVESWLGSEGHRKQMLDTEFLHTGVGVAMGEDGSLYFTQLFLRPPRR